MKKSRLHFAILNSSTAFIMSILKMGTQFASRTFFVYLLGVEFLGYNGLFTNVLSMLSLTELGIGASLTHALFKPYGEENYEKMGAYLRASKLVYRWIGIIIFILGILLIPSLPVLLKGTQVTDDVVLYFLLFLANSVVSYFFTYNRNVLIASQKNYLIEVIDFLVSTIGAIIQILILYLTRSYSNYLIAMIITTIMCNVVITIFARRELFYDLIDFKQKLQKEEIHQLKKDTLGNMSSKISTFFVFGTDNLLLSGFVGVTMVGIYSNYTLVISGITSLFSQLINPLAGTIGNLANTGNKNAYRQTYFRLYFLNYLLAYFAGLSLLYGLNPLMNLWFGKKLMLTSFTVILCVINFYLGFLRRTQWSFNNSFGLFWYQRWKALFETLLNLVLSLLFLIVFHLGVDGILLGTILSSILVVVWYEPYVIYKHVLDLPFRNFLILYGKQLLIFAIGFATSLAFKAIYPIPASFFQLSIALFIQLIPLTLIFMVFYWKDQNLRYLLNIFSRLILRRK